MAQTAQTLSVQISDEQRWRRVCAYDGTTVTLCDTPPTSRFILSTAIRSRCGFPLAKLVVLFCVTTGAVLEVSIAAFKVSEWEMSRQLYARLQPEDVLWQILRHLRGLGISTSC